MLHWMGTKFYWIFQIKCEFKCHLIKNLIRSIKHNKNIIHQHFMFKMSGMALKFSLVSITLHPTDIFQPKFFTKKGNFIYHSKVESNEWFYHAKRNDNPCSGRVWHLKGKRRAYIWIKKERFLSSTAHAVFYW